MKERRVVNGAALIGILEQRLDFGSKRDAAVMNTVVEGLDPDAVANEPKLPGWFVPQGEGKHSTETSQAVDAPFFERMKDHFGVGVIRFPAMPAGLTELGAEVVVVVDLAVVRDRERTVLIRHRLPCAVRQIDDGQSAVTEPDVLIGCDPRGRAIGAAMRHGVAHARDVRLRDPERGARKRERAVNAAHACFELDPRQTIGQMSPVICRRTAGGTPEQAPPEESQ